MWYLVRGVLILEIQSIARSGQYSRKPKCPLRSLKKVCTSLLVNATEYSLTSVVPVENDHQEDEDDDEYADDGEVSRRLSLTELYVPIEETRLADHMSSISQSYKPHTTLLSRTRAHPGRRRSSSRRRRRR